MSAEKKLLVGPDFDGSTFEKAFGKAARLPTPEDREKALEQSVADMRKELYRPKYEGTAQRDTRRPAGTNGWLSEKPLVNADTQKSAALIDAIADRYLPQPAAVSLKGIDPAIVRAKLTWALEQGKISKAQMEEQLALLGIGPDEPAPELVDA